MADYVVVALSPVLIMCLVGSLAFFLIQVFYRGELVPGVRWVMFWFVFAIVLVSRVSIEQGKGHGRFYGAALAVATWLYLTHTHKTALVGAILLALIWWCAHQLTRDCTLINENEDASGEGIMQGLWQSFEKSLVPPPPELKRPTLSALELMAIANLEKMRPKAPARPPGRSVIYFSLAALPLFGFGQLFLPVEDPHARKMGFVFLALYLASALCLLVTTSFLGLRRYLRQRSVEMPTSVTFSWIKFGAFVIGGVLLLALILPRPGANSTWKNLTYRIGHKEHKASHYAPPFNPPAEGDGAPAEHPAETHTVTADSPRPQSGNGGQSARDNGHGSNPNNQTGSGNGGGAGNQRTEGQGQPSDRSGQSPNRNDAPPREPLKIKDKTPIGASEQTETPPSHAEAGENKIPDQNGPGEKPTLAQQSNQRLPPGKEKPHQQPPKPNVLPEPHQEQPQPTPSETGTQKPKPPSDWLQRLLRWILITAIAALFLWLAIRYRKAIADAFRSLIASIRAFLKKLFSFRWRKTSSATEELPPPIASVVEPFAAYENPFLNGKDKTWPPERLVFYTYEALQSWAKEQGIQIQPQQTPHEFCAQLMAQFPDLAPELERFSFYYRHAAFAQRLPTYFETESLNRLWQYLGDSVTLTAR